MITENYFEQKNSHEVQKVGHTRWIPHKNFRTARQYCIHFTQFSTLWNKIVINLTNFSTKTKL